ncbi:DUF2877 domain-containing protein, partial [Elusimicrobiota bacterium]
FPQLIGLGPGLTPAGDDFILGALTACAMFSEKMFLKIKSIITPHLHMTSQLSRHYLLNALHKRTGEDIQNIFYSFIENSAEQSAFYSNRISGFGNTSGTYILKGIRWAISRIS